MSHLREDDTLAVWRLDRLGRNSQHLVITVKGLHKRGVGFHRKALQLTPAAPANEHEAWGQACVNGHGVRPGVRPGPEAWGQACVKSMGSGLKSMGSGLR